MVARANALGPEFDTVQDNEEAIVALAEREREIAALQAELRRLRRG